MTDQNDLLLNIALVIMYNEWKWTNKYLKKFEIRILILLTVLHYKSLND
jgi:hypothetical protein